MGSTSLAEGLQSLEEELENSFGRIQNHLKFLREDVGLEMQGPTSAVRTKSGRRDSLQRPETLEEWLLKDDVMSIPYEEPGNTPVSGDALYLSAEILGAGSHSHLRLNSHLMELSMRAAESVHVLKRERMRSGLISSNSANNHLAIVNRVGTELERCESVLQVIPPNSKFRLAWDLCGVFLIMLDAFLLPVTMAWEWEITPMPTSTSFSSRVLQLFAILSLVFWPLDIFVNFNTAFYIRGFIETRRWEIAKHYAYTWLGFDVCVVAVDYAAGLLGQVSRNAQSGTRRWPSGII